VATESSAIVFHARDNRNGEEVAIKQLRSSNLRGIKLRVFQREVIVLATAVHPTIVKFVGATDTRPFWIVTKWMPGGSLWHELTRRRRLTPTELTICAIDVARGMRFLHSRQIIHRDLKSLNVLLDSEGHARICDFGAARKLVKNAVMSQNVGTPHWMAPELIAGDPIYTEKIDVYSFGILLWEILTKKTPYEGMDAAQIAVDVLQWDKRPPLPADTPSTVREIIETCWSNVPSHRPSFYSLWKLFHTGPSCPGGWL
jgi:serine/threonine protein kinase